MKDTEEKRLFSIVIFLVIVAFVMILFPGEVAGFDLPETDPWYYQSDAVMTFWVPDKAQHYWGSYMISELSNPMISIAAGIAYEIYQEREGIGFSPRDVVADVLGVLSSKVNRSDSIRMWLDYDTNDKEILINVSLKW